MIALRLTIGRWINDLIHRARTPATVRRQLHLIVVEDTIARQPSGDAERCRAINAALTAMGR